MTLDDYRSILRKHWGYDDFRGIQADIIESIGSGHDTLGLMPTGGGKSLTFQVPALAMDGVCIVVTPLIALMKDQVIGLHKRGIRAAAIYSSMSSSEMSIQLDNAVFGAVKLLYVSPERLESELFLKKLSHMRVSFITVDEAHCISQWGYDFRPSYLKIADIRKLHPDAPMLALTATATPNVVDDIQERLGFKRKNVFRMSFERKNLSYVVRTTADKHSELLHILNSVDGSAIVYARSRQRTKEMADVLNADGISSTFFHAGLDNSVKDARQKAWQNGRVRVIVATNAFGMGIDKPDVRLVAHIDCPDSIEAYFQEAGRAGRDGKRAYAVLLYNDSDQRKLRKRIADQFPDREYIKDVYEHLAYFFQIAVGAGYNATFEFPIDRFCHTYKFFPLQVNSALHLLDRAGYIEYEYEKDSSARVMFSVVRDDLYRLHGNTTVEDRVIETLLRNYTGLFSDYVFIDLDYVAQQAGLDGDTTYKTLKELSHKRILNFIPQKNTPTIRYRQRREDKKDVTIPPAVYDERKREYTERIEAMLYYAKSDHTCRSKLLLRYFGEENAADCNHCDVCQARKGFSKDEQQKAVRIILALFDDGQRHHVTELKRLPLSTPLLDDTLRYLLAEEKLCNIDGYLEKG